MTITVPLEPQTEARLEAVARAKGISTGALVRQAIERVLADAPEEIGGQMPARPLRGLLEKYGPAPSAEEIDQSRAEMLANFPRSDF